MLLSTAIELARIARARVDTLRARIAGGATTSEDTVALAYELREMIDVVDAAAADAQSSAVRSALEGGEAFNPSFSRAMRVLSRARVQLALVIAGADDATTARLSAIDLDVTATVPDARWRQEVGTRRAQLVEALAPLLPASAYR
jgi:hypothetical protein